MRADEGKRGGRVLGIGLAAGLALTAPALAADRNDKLCYEAGSTDDQTIAGCTAVLGRKKPESRADQAAAYFNRGMAHANKEAVDKALADFDRAIGLDASDARYFRNRGEAHLSRDEGALALKDLDEAVRLDPAYGSAYTSRARAHNRQKAYDRALRDYAEAIRLAPDLSLNYYNRGLVHEATGETSLALADLEEAARRDPDDADTKAALARLRSANAAASASGGKMRPPPTTLADLAAQEQATAEVWARLPFATRKVLFVARKADAFGAYVARPSNVFAKGEALLSYIEPVGYSWSPQGDDLYRIAVTVDFELIAKDGRILGGQKGILTQRFLTHARNREFFVSGELSVKDIDPGDYTLTYTLHDDASGRTTRVEQPFTIR